MKRKTDASPAPGSSGMSNKPRRRSAVTALFAAAIALLLVLPAFASASPLGSVAFFKETFRSGSFINNDVTGPDGNVWFTDSQLIASTSAIGKITPSGTITEYEPSGLNAGAKLVGIAVGPENKLWMTDIGPNPGIVVVDPTSPGTATEISLAAGSIPQGIATGPDGNVWFANGGATPAIGQINPITQEIIKECSIAANGGNVGSEPHGIVTGPDGNLWFTDTGATKAIGRINPTTCAITEFATGENTLLNGASTTGPWGIVAGADGNVWFTGAGTEGSPAIGRITSSGEIEKYNAGLPASSVPAGLTTAADGKLWFTDDGGVAEVQKIKFEGTWATGNEFELCGKNFETNEAKCSKKLYNTTTNTTRNAVKAAYEAIFGPGSILTPACSGVPIACTVTFTARINPDLVTCTPLTGSGTCKGETIESGVSKGVGSLTYAGSIQWYPVAVPYGIAQVAYSGGSIWFPSASNTRQKIGRFGIEPKLPLKVKCTGSGSGTVSPIACGASSEFESGEKVELTATAEPGSEFTGWSGCTEEKEGKCVVIISGFTAKEITANFSSSGPTNLRELTLTKSAGGTGGTGSVTSKPKGINCATACNEAVASMYENSTVVLKAKAATGSTIASWTGCESSTGVGGTEGTCTIKMPEAHVDTEVAVAWSGTSKAITNPQPLTLSKGESSGKGTVKATGLTCEADCTEEVALYQGPTTKPGKLVTLKALAAYGSEFSGWSGCDSETEGNCLVTMEEAASVTATFTAKPTATLTVDKLGTGTGTVTSKPKAISCATVCITQDATVPEEAAVILKEKPALGMTFEGWTGACVGAGETCTVSLSGAGTVHAKFGGAPKAIANQQELTLTKAGSGLGTVKATGLTCEVLCTSTVSLYQGPNVEKAKPGKTVVLKALSAPGSAQVEWSGCLSEPTPTECSVTMEAAAGVTATFDELQ